MREDLGAEERDLLDSIRDLLISVGDIKKKLNRIWEDTYTRLMTDNNEK